MTAVDLTRPLEVGIGIAATLASACRATSNQQGG
jgi:hypothetical protein